MKRLFLILTCFLLTGCQAITFSVDGLLNAPNIADEQSAIYQALIESAGRGITLEYPRNGDYRSAFVLYDIDRDGEDETLAFYSLVSVADSNVKISVLDRDQNGIWRSMCELAGAGSSVDRVLFSGGDTIVGYSAQDYEENAVRMYRYTGGVLETIYENTYSVLETADLDGCGQNEIAVIKRSGPGLSVNILKAGSDNGYENYSLELDAAASDISGCCIGTLGNTQALYADLLSDSGGLTTEIFRLEGGAVSALISKNGLLPMTSRPAGYAARDYDGDGSVEIPVLSVFTGYETAPWGEAEYMTTFLRFDTEQNSLVFGSNAYCNLSDGYFITIPNRWLNMVTVLRNPGTGEVTFCKYDPSAASISLMPQLVSFAASDSSGGGAYTSAGYSVLYETDFTTYYVRVRADSSEPLVLTSDEMTDNFHTIE